MIRVTTGGVLRSYRSNLMNSYIRMSGSVNTVLSQRTFNSYAEDPASASKAFQLRSSYLRTESQRSVNSAIIGKYESGFAALESVVDKIDNRTPNSTWNAILYADNDPTADARVALGKVLDQMAASVVETMNSKYGSTFIFAGADGLNVPFDMADGVLTYRGVPVDAYVPELRLDGGNMITVDDQGRYDPTATTGMDYYVRADKTYLMTQDDFEKATTLLEQTDASGNTTEVRVNADGEMDPSGEYRVLGKTATVVTLNDDQLDGAFILRNDRGVPVTVDASGKIDPDGTNYLALGNGSLVTDDYQIPVAVTDTNGTPLATDEEGNIDTTGTGKYCLVMSSTEDGLISIDDYNKAVEDVAKLEYMMNETYYVDIGLGFQWNDNSDKLITASGFNAALQGIAYLGYGVDEEGDPKNIVSLINRMADILNNYTDEAWRNGGGDDFFRLMGKFEDAAETLHTERSNMDGATLGLKDNYSRLDDEIYTLGEQYSAIEDVDMAEALTDFLWAQYCYNAALKMGSSILGPSLMDYLE